MKKTITTLLLSTGIIATASAATATPPATATPSAPQYQAAPSYQSPIARTQGSTITSNQKTSANQEASSYNKKATTATTFNKSLYLGGTLNSPIKLEAGQTNADVSGICEACAKTYGTAVPSSFEAFSQNVGKLNYSTTFSQAQLHALYDQLRTYGYSKTAAIYSK